MTYIFDTDKIEKWANFSGDYNPIHFDPVAASRVSESGLIAHGMLVLMFAKQKLSDAHLLRTAAGRPLACVKSWFRDPVPQGIPVSIQVADRDSKSRFSVTGDGTKDRYFQGSVSDVDVFESLDWEEVHHLPATDLAEKWEYFAGSFPHISAPWIFFDALLFEMFIRHQSGEMLAKRLGGKDQARYVVQTSQRVLFDPVALDSLSYRDAIALTYHFRKEPDLVDGDRLLSTVQLAAFLDRRQVMQSEAGLLLQR